MKKAFVLAAAVMASAFMMGSTFQSSAVATDLGSVEMSFNTCDHRLPIERKAEA